MSACDDGHCITCSDEGVADARARAPATTALRSASATTAQRSEVDDRPRRAGRAGRQRCSCTPASRSLRLRGCRVKFVDEFRDAELGRVLAARDRRHGRAGPPLQGHGGLRRAHAHDLQVRRRRPAARERRARARPRLPGLRDPDGPRRRRHRRRARAGRDLHLLRRHDARARQPGTLLEAKAEGADIRMVYSPLDALRIARENPEREVVFFAVGFETTAPSTALTLMRAKAEGMRNFSVLLQPRHDRAAAARAARVARPAARRLHRPGARLDRGRRAAVRVHPGRLRQADRDLGLRAARPAAVGAHDPAAAGRGPLRGREPVQARRPLRRQPAGAARAAGGVRAAAALRVARARLHLAQRR